MVERTSSARSSTKRLLDIVFAGCGLVALSPLILAVSLAILVTMGRPIFFRQQRPGLGGRPFTILKFRTMTGPARSASELDDPDLRVTRLGYRLRQTSIDELPELWNVLRGDMSLVGPRPLLMHYLEHYSPEQMRRHEVKPGVTGLAQVYGRHALEWERRFRLDVWYVDHWSVRMDAAIMFRTLSILGTGLARPDPTEERFAFDGSGDVDATGS